MAGFDAPTLEVPNYRRFFAGQLVSLSGNWMQTVAEHLG